MCVTCVVRVVEIDEVRELIENGEKMECKKCGKQFRAGMRVAHAKKGNGVIMKRSMFPFLKEDEIAVLMDNGDEDVIRVTSWLRHDGD